MVGNPIFTLHAVCYYAWF